jgi:hypothetical protein
MSYDPSNPDEVREYRVVIQRSATEVVTVGGEEASTIERAQELAHDRAQGDLCHQCAKHLSLSDPGDDLVEIVDVDGTVVTRDFEAEDLEARLRGTRLAAFLEVADALATISTGETNAPVRNKLREVAVKLRGAARLTGRLDLS